VGIITVMTPSSVDPSLRLLLALVALVGTAEGKVIDIVGVGRVRGTQAGQVDEFFGIKYGVARRFEQSVKAKPWSDVQDATEEGPPCLQQYNGGFRGVEDCLTLDIRGCTEHSANTLRPVLLWIHGGGLQSGSSSEGNLYNGTSLVEHSDCGIVYVAIQYRLNLFGYLDHPSFPSANFGIRDQQLALQWVQDHIHSFGGDKTRVTIAGESAGGASVAMHLSSALSLGLFSAAIAESTWTSSVTGNKPRSYAQIYGSRCTEAACPQHTNSSELLKCLQDIENATALALISDCAMYPPFVSVDGYPGMFKQSVWKTARTGGFAPVPIIVGSQTGEWEFSSYSGGNTTSYALYEFAMEQNFDAFRTNPLQALEVGVMLESARLHYPAKDHPNTFDDEDGRDTALLTDLLFTCMTDQMTRNHKHASARRYLFSDTPKYLNDTGPQALLQNYAYHTLELSYVFDSFSVTFPDEHGLLQQVVRKSDATLSKAMQDYWVSFAIDHKPISAFAAWPLASEGKMLEFAPEARSDFPSIDFRKPQCDHIVKLFDSAFR